MAKGKSKGASKDGPTTKEQTPKTGRRSAPPPYLGRQVIQDPWINQGPKIREFLADQRLEDHKVTVTITQGEMTFIFHFKEVDSMRLSKVSRTLTLEQYTKWRAERAVARKANDQATAWSNFKAKVHVRTCLSISGVSDPEVLGKPAMQVIMSVLSPPEKDLLGLTQKNWNPMSTERLETFLGPVQAKLTAERMDEKRVAYIEARFRGDTEARNPCPHEWWVSQGIGHTPGGAKAVAKAIQPINPLEGKAGQSELSGDAEGAQERRGRSRSATKRKGRSKSRGKGGPADEEEIL